MTKWALKSKFYGWSKRKKAIPQPRLPVDPFPITLCSREHFTKRTWVRLASTLAKKSLLRSSVKEWMFYAKFILGFRHPQNGRFQSIRLPETGLTVGPHAGNGGYLSAAESNYSLPTRSRISTLHRCALPTTMLLSWRIWLQRRLCGALFVLSRHVPAKSLLFWTVSLRQELQATDRACSWVHPTLGLSTPGGIDRKLMSWASDASTDVGRRACTQLILWPIFHAYNTGQAALFTWLIGSVWWNHFC